MKGHSPYAGPIMVIHLLASLACFPHFFSWTAFFTMLAGTVVFGQGINLAYHRLLAHRSFKLPLWLERLYVLLALCCMEETPAKWVSTHRLHHAKAESEEDPHSPLRSMFWAHLGWLVSAEGQLKVHSRLVPDLLSDPFYRFLERAPWFSPLLYLIQICVYYTLGGEGLVVWGVFVRTVVVWHLTWSVNSLAHTFGYRNYETGEQSRNNWLVALLASGEGWHNNHHWDPASASVQHYWWEIDLTFYHIVLLERLGLATEVRRPRRQ